MDNMEYISDFFISSNDMEKIKEFETTKLSEILSKTTNEEHIKQIKRDIL